MLRNLKMAYYAVARGRETGIFRSWAECEIQTKGFSGAAFKRFKSQKEAEQFIDNAPPAKKQKFHTKMSFSAAVDEISKKTEQKADETTKSKTDEGTTRKTDGDPGDEAFLNLPEFPDEPSTSKQTLKAKRQDKSSEKAAKIFVKAAKNYEKAAKILEKTAQNPKTTASTKLPGAATKTTAARTKIPYDPPKPTTQKTYRGGFKFNEDSDGFVHVYTDGSSFGNGKYSAAAGLGVFFGDNHPLNVSAPVTGRPTNNAGEIQAAISAIKVAQRCDVKRLNIFTDSQFLMKSACLWIPVWKAKDWKVSKGKSVVNQKDFKELDSLIESGNMLVKWSYIPAHKGKHGNEEADKLAKNGASLYRTKRDLEEGKGSDSSDEF